MTTHSSAAPALTSSPRSLSPSLERQFQDPDQFNNCCAHTIDEDLKVQRMSHICVKKKDVSSLPTCPLHEEFLLQDARSCDIPEHMKHSSAPMLRVCLVSVSTWGLHWKEFSLVWFMLPATHWHTPDRFREVCSMDSLSSQFSGTSEPPRTQGITDQNSLCCPSNRGLALTRKSSNWR